MEDKWRLCDAARDGDYDGVISLLDGGGDVNCKGRFGRTPLHWASRNGYEGVVSLLIERGAQVESKNQVRIF